MKLSDRLQAFTVFPGRTYRNGNLMSFPKVNLDTSQVLRSANTS